MQVLLIAEDGFKFIKIMTKKKHTKSEKPTMLAPLVDGDTITPTLRRVLSQKIKSGENDTVERFLQCTERLQETTPAFGIKDIYYLASTRELEPSQTLRLFTAWKEKMIAWGKLEEADSCYSDNPLYVFL